LHRAGNFLAPSSLGRFGGVGSSAPENEKKSEFFFVLFVTFCNFAAKIKIKS
jgi:hypothetical protein